MKRSWLALCLIALVLAISGLGMYRASSSKLHQVISRFQEALPKGTVFTYKSSSPAFLVRGVILKDVTFKNGDVTFHAHHIRIGHPQFLPDGKLSLSSLLFTGTEYNTSQIHLGIKKIIFRHLILPPSSTPLKNTDLETNSIHSLATILSFSPKDITSLRFSRTSVIGLTLTFKRPIETPNQNLTIRNASAEALTLEGYGVGTRVNGTLTKLILGVNVTPHDLNSFGTTMASALLMPKVKNIQTSVPATLTLAYMEAKEGTPHLLQHPFKGNAQVTEEFWNKPLDLLWQNSGSLSFNNLKLSFEQNTDTSSAQLDNLYVSRRNDNGNLKTELRLKGFHIRPKQKLDLPFMVNGAQGLLRMSIQSHQEGSIWQSDVTGHLTLDNIGDVTLNSHYTLPNNNPFYEQNNPSYSFAKEVEFNNSILAIHGDHFIDLGIALAQQVISSTSRELLRQSILHNLNNMAETRSFITPLADYMSNPAGRTLNISLGELSPETLSHIPLNASAGRLVDSFHVTSVSAR